MTIITQGGQRLFDMTVSHISNLPSLQWQACDIARAIDVQLGEEQRFWKEEILQASKLLANKYANYAGGYNTWAICMMNNLGWRVVAYTACPPGKFLDSVSRKCVTETMPIDPSDIDIPEIKKKDYTIFMIMGGVVLLLLLGINKTPK